MELIGSVLVLFALLIFLVLLSPNKSDITAALIGALRSLFGVGVWLLPLLVGGIGLWLALREVATNNGHSPWRVAGALGFFVAFVSFAHLIAGATDINRVIAQGAGGGLLGWTVGLGLTTALGLPAALAILTVLTLLSALALVGVTVGEAMEKLAAGWRSARTASRGPEGGVINPPLPGMEPFYQRWWRKLVTHRVFDRASCEAVGHPPLVTSDWFANRGVRPAPAPGPQPTRGAAPQPAAAPQAHIIGDRSARQRAAGMAVADTRRHLGG